MKDPQEGAIPASSFARAAAALALETDANTGLPDSDSSLSDSSSDSNERDDYQQGDNMDSDEDEESIEGDCGDKCLNGDFGASGSGVHMLSRVAHENSHKNFTDDANLADNTLAVDGNKTNGNMQQSVFLNAASSLHSESDKNGVTMPQEHVENSTDGVTEDTIANNDINTASSTENMQQSDTMLGDTSSSPLHSDSGKDTVMNGSSHENINVQTPKESQSSAFAHEHTESPGTPGHHNSFDGDDHRSNRDSMPHNNPSDSINNTPTTNNKEEHIYNLCPTYVPSPGSLDDSFLMSPPPPLSSRKDSKSITSSTKKDSKSITTESSSFISRGLNLFGRRAASSRYTSHDDGSVISELSDVKSIQSSRMTTLNNNNPILDQKREDARVQAHLQEQGLILLKRLIEFLSVCPPSPEEILQNGTAAAAAHHDSRDNNTRKKPRGLTLPASAVGWISVQISILDNDEEANKLNLDKDIIDDCPKQQIQMVQSLLRRVTSIRLTNDKWPPALPALISEVGETVKRKAFSSIPERGIVSTASSKILSKFTADQSSVAPLSTGASLGDSVSTGTAKEIVLTTFQRYFHELQYNPRVDMKLFPYATKVVVDGIPPHWIRHLDTLNKLDMFQMERGCILDINRLFFSSDRVEGDGPSDMDGCEASSLYMYKSMTKLRLSNCAMSEAAGLRGRRRLKSNVPSNVESSDGLNTTHSTRLPTLSRFPNLESLNLSHNEFFRTKTAFAGLSSLPFLSSINLSYNRLSSMNNIFMHIGNVKELILSGNEISSTRGLDRLFSLERLALDENKIQHLADISGLAKLPFLMNLDIKGNPLEASDPESCRIEVFNLFREMRCKSMPKYATYRDMQQLLPVLDSALATKDELVAIKNLTFRQAVLVDSANDTEMAETTEMKVELLTKNMDTRRVTKAASSRIVHCRSSDLALNGKVTLALNGKVTKDAPKIDSELSQEAAPTILVQYNIDDVITSIRPITEASDSSHANDASYNRSRTQSSFSVGKLDKKVSEIFEADSPFSLPSSILAEADELVWKPIPLHETLPDYEPPEPDTKFCVENTIGSVSVTCEKESSLDQDQFSLDRNNSASHADYKDIYKDRINDDLEKDSDEVDELDELTRSKAMFGGIWEQTYRNNLANGSVAFDADNSSTCTSNKPAIDYDAEELNSFYDGPSDYASIFVSSDLDLYYDSFVFPRGSDDESQEDTLQKDLTMPPRIQLFKFDRKALDDRFRTQHDLSERYIGVWKEDLLACGSFARSRVKPMQMQKRGFHGEDIIQSGKGALVSGSRKIVVCLSDSALYLIVDDEVASTQNHSAGAKRDFPSRIPQDATFASAYWPHALIRHSLDCLVGITIGFQFQRLLLRFSVSNANGMTLEYTYVILTSNKLQTISLLQKLQSHVSDARANSVNNQAVLIENDDKAFLEALGAKTDEVVLHYQILRQVWKRGDREAARRSFVLTDSMIYLLDESYDGDGSNLDSKVRRLGDISLTVIDSAPLTRVTEVRAANEDPRMITLVILPLNKLKRAHRWRLLCNDGEGAERLIDDVRKAMRGST